MFKHLLLVILCAVSFQLEAKEHKKEHAKQKVVKKEHKEYKEYMCDPLDLINSPILIGGSKFGLSININRVFGCISLESYIDMKISTDEDIHALNDDPTPDKDYKTKLLNLKEQKILFYTNEFTERKEAFMQKHYLKNYKAGEFPIKIPF